ncbi:MAG: TIGR02147 family protein [Bdellovibrionaceae bacterium]|nr:TIGR02147 family protein [Pseudobdellovibrionaceae bacterium]
MEIFEYTDYKKFVNERLKSHPKQGRGVYSQIAKHLNIHTSLVSHIFSGDKHLSFEQSCDLAQFLGLTSLQEDYFINMVLKSRAGTARARQRCDHQLEIIRQKSQMLNERVISDTVLSESQSSVFLSQWYYTAIKLMISLSSYKNADEIAEKIHLPKKLVADVLEFLVTNGLLKYENGEYIQGPARLHFSSDSPFVSRHHANWRIKAIEKINDKDETSLHFTMPANLSQATVMQIRKKMVEQIESITQIVDASEPETTYCLNIDWMKIV